MRSDRPSAPLRTVRMTAMSLLRQIVPPFLWTLASRARSGPRRERQPPGDYLSWLHSSIPGWLNPGNVRAFDHCIREMPDGAVVEIGCHAGLSTNAIGHFIARHGRTASFFSADPWLANPDMPAPLGSGLEPQEWAEQQRGFIRDTFDRATRLNSADRLPHHFELLSDAFFAAWQAHETRTDYFGRRASLGGAIAFAYIDGDHSFEQTWADFSNVDRHLARGGFVLFDDTGAGWYYGATEAAVRAAALPGYRLVSRAPHYCVQKTA